MGYLYLPLLMLEGHNQKKSYPPNQVTSLTYSTVTFMAFQLKSMAFPIKLTPNYPSQGEKLLNFGFWPLGLAFKIFFGHFLFC